MLFLNSVSKSFRGKHEAVSAVRGVSLRVRRGELCVMLGHSGAGKSTLLKLISGQLVPDEGQVEIDGRRMMPRTRRPLQHRIGVVHQRFELVGRLSSLDNVLLGRLPWIPWTRSLIRRWLPEERAEACRWLAKVGLEPNHAVRLAGQLSGGQQQRVAIARALIRQPALILADEPVASLDPENSRAVLTLLREAAHECNIAVLCSLHQPDMALEFADRIIHLSDGMIEFDGMLSDWARKPERSRRTNPLADGERDPGDERILPSGDSGDRSGGPTLIPDEVSSRP